MQTEIYRYAEWIWIAVGAVWLIGAVSAKKTVRREGLGSRMMQLAFLATAGALVFWRKLPVGPLAGRFVPETPAIAWRGLAVTAAGCAFAVWARILLGGNWSGSVTVKKDHLLIRQGPYAIVRHPIYSGLLLGLLGTGLIVGEWRALAGLALAFAGWWMKSRVEESFMVDRFGAEYTGYRREVKAIIPFVL
ncbi:MAG: isoprenylcysteine carboxylmethyltransferase family protein [Bryobacteraceae bacterium]|jgi:protein-S-isoprenylcysteine O-methyltransferase